MEKFKNILKKMMLIIWFLADHQLDIPEFKDFEIAEEGFSEDWK